MDILNKDDIAALLQYDLNIEVETTVDSTNTILKQLGRQGAPEGVVLLADNQTGGRGRRGRSFFSPPGCGLYFSILLRPNLLPQKAALLTTAAAVAVSDAIDCVCGVHSSIKWVNDVFVGDKKCCGILTEADIDPATGKLDFAVVGIGINVLPPKDSFPDELAGIAAPIYDTRPDTAVRSRLAAEVLNRFFALYRAGDTAAFIDTYRQKSRVIGHHINILKGDTVTPAYAKDIDSDCNLLVVFDDGREEALSSGEISIRVTK